MPSIWLWLLMFLNNNYWFNYWRTNNLSVISKSAFWLTVYLFQYWPISTFCCCRAHAYYLWSKIPAMQIYLKEQILQFSPFTIEDFSRFQIYYFSFRLMTCAMGEVTDQQERPLELGDIMPLDRKSYDKMRPPKYKGLKHFSCNFQS